jgi:hypothetical protein
VYSGDLVLPGFGKSGDDLEGRQSTVNSRQLLRRGGKKDNAETQRTLSLAEKSRFLISDRWYLLASRGGGRFHLDDKVEIVKAPASEGGRYKGRRGGPPEGGRYKG